MSQKKLFADQRTETVHRFVVAGEIGQWDCPKSETKSPVGSQMDTSVSQQHKNLVCGSIPQTPPDSSTGERVLRTVGHRNPSSAQKHKKSSWVLQRDWQLHGIPKFLQMDNDMSLTGGRMHPRTMGQLVRFCLACRVIPVFTPERRPASNALVERYNGLWQEKVWQRYRFRTLGQLRERSQAFQKAYNTYLKQRLIRQGKGVLFHVRLRYLPKKIRWIHPLPLCRGQIWFIRRIDEDGQIQVLNETIRLPKRYAHEFVRVVIRTGPQSLSVYWKDSPHGRFKRMAHRTYKLRDKARTPFL